MGGMTGLLFLLWVGVTVSTAAELQKRIIGGKECDKKERLYHVKLEATFGNKYIPCGGSLISDRWILTAAHCWKKGSTMTAILGVHPGPPDETVQITAEPVIFQDTNGKEHDIMLLQLPKPTKIAPVKLPDCDHPPTKGKEVQIAGHASTEMDRDTKERIPGESPTLQCANIPVVDCAELKDKVAREKLDWLHQHWLCAKSSKMDICIGDSGGGVVFNDMIYGVISFTGNGKYACAAAAGFMDVCKYLPWIQKTIGP